MASLATRKDQKSAESFFFQINILGNQVITDNVSSVVVECKWQRTGGESSKESHYKLLMHHTHILSLSPKTTLESWPPGLGAMKQLSKCVKLTLAYAATVPSCQQYH